jgi:hypothetical protein
MSKGQSGQKGKNNNRRPQPRQAVSASVSSSQPLISGRNFFKKHSRAIVVVSLIATSSVYVLKEFLIGGLRERTEILVNARTAETLAMGQLSVADDLDWSEKRLYWAIQHPVQSPTTEVQPPSSLSPSLSSNDVGAPTTPSSGEQAKRFLLESVTELTSMSERVSLRSAAVGNLLRTGGLLKVPEKDQIDAIDGELRQILFNIGDAHSHITDDLSSYESMNHQLALYESRLMQLDTQVMEIATRVSENVDVVIYEGHKEQDNLSLFLAAFWAASTVLAFAAALSKPEGADKALEVE